MEKNVKKLLFINCDKLTFQFLDTKYKGEPLNFMWRENNFSAFFWMLLQTPKRNIHQAGTIEINGVVKMKGRLEVEKELCYKYPVIIDHLQSRRRVNLLNTLESLMFGVYIRRRILFELVGVLDECEDFTEAYDCFLKQYGFSHEKLPMEEAFKFYEEYHKGKIPLLDPSVF